MKGRGALVCITPNRLRGVIIFVWSRKWLRVHGILTVFCIFVGEIDVGFADFQILVEVNGLETLAEVEVHSAAHHVVTGIELVGGFGWFRSQSDFEDTQLIHANGLSFEKQFTQTVLHLYQNATDDGL